MVILIFIYFYFNWYTLILKINLNDLDYAGRPEFWDEIYEEQLKIHNESNGILTTEDVKKMVKLDCFIKESFRFSTDIGNHIWSFNFLFYRSKYCEVEIVHRNPKA